jgi:hypothetical protein
MQKKIPKEEKRRKRAHKEKSENIKASIAKIFGVSPKLLRGRPVQDDKEAFVKNELLPLVRFHEKKLQELIDSVRIKAAK